MKKLSYLMLAFSIGISNLVYSCPFKITNDGNLDLILIEHKSAPEKKYHVKAGETIEIPGAAPQTYVWVYVQDKVGANKFELKYGIIEYQCIKEGDPLPHLKYSEFESKVRDEGSSGDEHPGYYSNEQDFEPIYMSVAHFEEIIEDDPEEFDSVPKTLVEPIAVSPLSKLSIAATAKLIEQGKLTIEELKQKAPEEIVERVEQYLKAQ